MPRDVLLIIDVQAGFINDFTAHIPEKVASLQGRFNTVFATRFVNPPGSLHRRLMNWHRFGPDSTEIALAFTPEDHVHLFDKATYSALTPGLTKALAAARPDRVVLAGIATDNCILKTAVDLFEHAVEPVVLTDAVASHGGHAAHDCGLMLLRRFIGASQLIEIEDLFV